MKDTDIWNEYSGNIRNWMPPNKTFQLGTVRIHVLSGDLLKLMTVLNLKLQVMLLKQMCAKNSTENIKGKMK